MNLFEIDNKYRYGFHVRKRKTFTETVTFVVRSPINAMQIYLSNGYGYALANVNIPDILEAKRLLQRHDIFICAHSLMIHNLAGKVDPDDERLPEIQKRVILGLAREIDIMAALGGGAVVVAT